MAIVNVQGQTGGGGVLKYTSLIGSSTTMGLQTKTLVCDFVPLVIQVITTNDGRANTGTEYRLKSSDTFVKIEGSLAEVTVSDKTISVNVFLASVGTVYWKIYAWGIG